MCVVRGSRLFIDAVRVARERSRHPDLDADHASESIRCGSLPSGIDLHHTDLGNRGPRSSWSTPGSLHLSLESGRRGSASRRGCGPLVDESGVVESFHTIVADAWDRGIPADVVLAETEVRSSRPSGAASPNPMPADRTLSREASPQGTVPPHPGGQHSIGRLGGRTAMPRRHPPRRKPGPSVPGESSSEPPAPHRTGGTQTTSIAGGRTGAPRRDHATRDDRRSTSVEPVDEHGPLDRLARPPHPRLGNLAEFSRSTRSGAAKRNPRSSRRPPLISRFESSGPAALSRAAETRSGRSHSPGRRR